MAYHDNQDLVAEFENGVRTVSKEYDIKWPTMQCKVTDILCEKKGRCRGIIKLEYMEQLSQIAFQLGM